MSLLHLMLQRHGAALALSLVLSLVSAGLGVGVIAFINDRLLVGHAVDASMLGMYGGLLVLLFLLSTASQLLMSRLGHSVVFELRRMLVKRVLDTPIAQIESIGAAKIIASLSSDTSHISGAFLSLPHAVYGAAVSLGAFGYLAWLSLPLFGATIAWIFLTVAVAYKLLSRIEHHFSLARDVEDELVADYQAVIEGRKELALNRVRARLLYQEEFELHARNERDHAQRGDRWNSINDNFVNVMTFGAIGLAFYLAGYMGWATTETAATYALTILYVGTPLALVVHAVPSLIAGNVALSKVGELALAEYSESFEPEALRPALRSFQKIELRGVHYRYPEIDGEGGFAVGPIDWTLKRGEIVFVVGGNGSGKSTLARLVSGLCEPSGGELHVDGKRISAEKSGELRSLFSAVFSDFHLFKQLLGADGPADPGDARAWLSTLELSSKAEIADGNLSNVRLSTGQRKRLALLLGILEDRPILLLDEWAADQDPTFRRIFYRELLPQLRAAGKTILAITHDEAYFGVADRVVKLDAGRFVPVPQPITATVSSISAL